MVSDELDELLEYIKSISTKAKMFHYPGGDWYIKDNIIKMLTKAPCKKCALVEVFGGSGTITQYAPRDKFSVLIYNDKDELITNLIRVVKEKPDALVKILAVIPYSREIHNYILDLYKKNGLSDLDPVTKAVYMFYLINSAINGVLKAGFSYSKQTNEAKKFTSRISAIFEFYKKFRDVVVESLDFSELMSKYDSENTVFYLDPPYIGNRKERYYRLAITPGDVAKMTAILNNIRGYYLLKLHEDQETMYNGLNYKNKITIQANKRMLVQNTQREKFNYIFLTNYDTSPY